MGIYIYSLIVTAIVTAGVTGWALNAYGNYLIRRQERMQEKLITVNEYGMAKVTAASILAVDDRSYFPPDIREFPPVYNKFIHEPASNATASWLREIITLTNPSETALDKIRVVTIVAAIYDRLIPEKLVRIDSRTKELYKSLLYELELVDVVMKAKDSLPMTTSTPPANLSTLYGMTDVVGGHLISCASRGKYGSFEFFASTCRSKMTRAQITISHADIKSMATAYAAMSQIKIPRSYVVYDKLAVALMYPEKTGNQKRLQLVRS